MPPPTVAEVTGRLVGWLERLMPDRERADRLVGVLRAEFGSVAEPVDAAWCARIEAAAHAHSRHLLLEFDPTGHGEPDTVSRGWPPPEAAEVRARAAGFGEVRRLPDGVAVVRLDTLDAYGMAQPYVDAAFSLVRGARAVVLDLRANGGGDPGTLAAVAGWLLGDAAQQLSEVTYADRRRQWWTPERPPGTACPDLPAVVLTSAATFSSGEALAYHLQARRRVRVVGEATPGAADHVTPIRLAATVRGILPEAVVVDAVTGGNWEGHGVRPDLPCPAADALDAAVRLLARSPG
jgi:peptidase S41-like protein